MKNIILSIMNPKSKAYVIAMLCLLTRSYPPLFAQSLHASDTTLEIITTASPDVAPLDQINYLVTITNVGQLDGKNIVLTDTLPANTTFVSEEQISGPAAKCTTPATGTTGTVTCSIPTLVPHDSAAFSIIVTAPATKDVLTINNIATVTSSTALAASDGALTIVDPSFSPPIIFKLGSPNPVIAGDSLTYIITINNTMDSPTAGTLTDSTPANTTFVSLEQIFGTPFSCSTPAIGSTGSITCTGTLPSGESASFALVVKVNDDTADGTIITNTSSFDDQSSTDTIEVKTSTVLVLSKLAPSQASAGNLLTYTLQVTNDGPTDAQNVILTDILPSNISFVSASDGGTFVGGQVIFNLGTIPVGTTATVTITANVNSGVRPGTILNNTATVTSDTPNTGDPSTTTQTVIGALPPSNPFPIILFPSGGIPSPACGC
jgi:uncharacterized repeat protein (TIGR01451 family)